MSGKQELEKVQEKSVKPITKAQEALLEVLRDEKHVGLSVEDIIKLAEISRATYYNCFQDQNFIAALETAMMEYRSQNDFAVMKNIAEQARAGKNHNFAALFERLQGRLREGGEKPAQIVLIIGAEGVTINRPPLVGKVIEGEVVKNEDKD